MAAIWALTSSVCSAMSLAMSAEAAVSPAAITPRPGRRITRGRESVAATPSGRLRENLAT